MLALYGMYGIMVYGLYGMLEFKLCCEMLLLLNMVNMDRWKTLE